MQRSTQCLKNRLVLLAESPRYRSQSHTSLEEFKRKLNTRLAIRHRADLFEASILTNKISLLQGQSYFVQIFVKLRTAEGKHTKSAYVGQTISQGNANKGAKSIVTSLLSDLCMANRNAAISSHPMGSIPGYPGAFVKTGLRNAF